MQKKNVIIIKDVRRRCTRIGPFKKLDDVITGQRRNTSQD